MARQHDDYGLGYRSLAVSSSRLARRAPGLGYGVSEGHGSWKWRCRGVRAAARRKRSSCCAQVVPALSSRHDHELLSEFARRWEHHKLYCTWLKQLFYPLDRVLPGDVKLKTVTTQGMNLFKTIVFNAKKEDIVAAIQRAIERERAGEPVRACVVGTRAGSSRNRRLLRH